MSHSTNLLTNKQQKHPKINFQPYLYSAAEPKDNNLPAEIVAELIDERDKYYDKIKRNIKTEAHRLRLAI